MISNKQRNWVNQVKTKGTSNIDSANQHQQLLMKIRIRLKQENNQEDGGRHIQLDFDELRDNKQFLKETVTEERIQEMLNTKGTLKELGVARYNKYLQLVKQWIFNMWQTLVQKMQEIQKTFPNRGKPTQKRPMGKTRSEQEQEKTLIYNKELWGGNQNRRRPNNWNHTQNKNY